MTLQPTILAPSSFDHFYRGGAQLAAFRGTAAASHRPEEWLGSTVTRAGRATDGLSSIGDHHLRDLIEADPEGWLGQDHVNRYGTNSSMLVKLIDCGQRLPVHLHPTRRFADRHLGCPYGKTEAWVVLEGEGEGGGGTAYIGTNRPVRPAEWGEMVLAQATDEMLALLYPVALSPGDSVLVPSGTPHSIAAGTFVLEIQEPTDWSIVLEWDGFEIDGNVEGHLGLGFDVALQAIRPAALDAGQIDSLTKRATAVRPGGSPQAVLPPAAEPYFRVWRLEAPPMCPLPAGFGVLLVTGGSGRLTAPGAEIDAKPGTAVVVPAATPCSLHGEVYGYFAQPPSPDAPETEEWDA